MGAGGSRVGEDRRRRRADRRTPAALPSASRVEAVHPSNDLKAKAFGRLCYMLAERSLALLIIPG